MPKKINVKDKLLNDTLDLSCCDLKVVPVKEISVLRRAAIVDFSNNYLTHLPDNFVILTQIVKLDLSKNYLTELPHNFGELVQLKHLDLYSNRISRLPLSIGKLKNLRWLDLKENPLTPEVASIAGPCTTSSDCQNCARNVVNYLSEVIETIEKAVRVINENQNTEPAITVPKKDIHEMKKKKSDKEKNNTLVDGNKQQKLVEKSNEKSSKRKQKPQNVKIKKGGLIRFLYRTFLWLLLLLFFTIITIPFLPNAEEILDYIKEKTGLPIQRYKINIQLPPVVNKKVQLFINYSHSFANDIYKKYFEQHSVKVNKEL